MKYGLILWLCLRGFSLCAGEDKPLLPTSIQDAAAIEARVTSRKCSIWKKTAKTAELTLRMGVVCGAYYGFNLGSTYLLNEIEDPINQSAAATALGSLSTVVAMTALWPITSVLYPAVYWVLGRSKSGVIFSIDWLQQAYYTRAQLDASAQEMLDPLVLQYINMKNQFLVGCQLADFFSNVSAAKKMDLFSQQIGLLLSDFLDNQSFDPDHGSISEHAALVIGGLILKFEIQEEAYPSLKKRILHRIKERNKQSRYPRADWENISKIALDLWWAKAMDIASGGP